MYIDTHCHLHDEKFNGIIDQVVLEYQKYGISAVSGPVGVTAAIGSAAKASLKNLIPIMALITINLGLFNLLPIPALDGGRLLFIFIEMVTRKKIPAKYEATIHAIGFIIFILFMLAVTAKDIRALIIR